MSETRHAFVKANWHAHIVERALNGFCEIIPERAVDVFDVPGAFELPLICRDLAATGRYTTVTAAAFVVNGGIYRHEFVAQAVVSGLLQAGLETGIPILSLSLTPHNYQASKHHDAIFLEHFVEKGREAARAAILITQTRQRLVVAL